MSSPDAVSTNSDAQVVQILGLLEEEGDSLARRHAWQALQLEATFTSVATESQGAIATLASNGFRYIKNETFWDRTNRLPIFGPLNDKEWQAIKAVTSTGPRYHYRIRGGNLLINPVPTAGYNFYFEYQSLNWILNGATYKQYFTADADTILLPEDLVLKGLRWRWKKEKGLAFAQDFDDYEDAVLEAIARDGGKPTLNMSNEEGTVKPGIFVPAGNWSVS